MESMGVVVRRYIYRSSNNYYLSLHLLNLLFFTAASLLCSFLKRFSFLFRYIFVIKFYVIIFLRSINTHTGNYGYPTAAI